MWSDYTLQFCSFTPCPRIIVPWKALAAWQGWGGPAVQYRQSTPVLGNLGTVADRRSTF